MNQQQINAGYSLLEILVAIGLLSLITTSALQSSKALLEALKLQRVLAEFSFQIEHQLARSQLTGKILTADFDLVEQNLKMDGRILQRFENSLSRAKFGNIYSKNPMTIVFYPNHSVSPGSITLRPKGCVIVVSQKGALRSSC